jgi:hypothetical protein
MREKMEAMQKQIEGFIDTLNQEISQRVAINRPPEDRSLMPVIQISSLARAEKRATQAEPKKKRS